MKNLILCLCMLAFIGCKSDKGKETSGIVQMDNLSCKDYTAPFKQAIKNIINQQDKSFFDLKDSTFVVTTIDSCLKTHNRYSVKNLKDPNLAVMVDSKEYESINNCGGGVSSPRSELVTRNYKETILNEIDSQVINMSVSTDRPCSITLSSSKNHLTLVLNVDYKEMERITYDLSNMQHPAELIYRFKKQNYTSKMNPFQLTESEANSHLKDCVNQQEQGCIDTGKTVRDYIDLF